MLQQTIAQSADQMGSMLQMKEALNLKISVGMNALQLQEITSDFKINAQR